MAPFTLKGFIFDFALKHLIGPTKFCLWKIKLVWCPRISNAALGHSRLLH